MPPRINFILLGHKSLPVPVRSGERGLSPLRIENKTGYQLQQIFRVMIRKPEWAASALSGCCSMSAKPDQHEKQAARKARTKRLIRIGAEVEAYCGEITDLDAFKDYLQQYSAAIRGTQKKEQKDSRYDPDDLLAFLGQDQETQKKL